ncbi:MAG: hypothetical protein K2Q18_11510 [Bdellovibrionales bacterium]|nr:hypothetical protein [Bdellovibrionales bacterium]
MKSIKFVQSLVLMSSLFLGSAYAQSAYRADEVKAQPQAYRLGDSNDLQHDQMIVEQGKESTGSKLDAALKHQKDVFKIRSIKYGI